MNDYSHLGRVLLIVGIVAVLLGLIFIVFPKMPLGRLPGDIAFKRENFSFYFPLTTCILISVALTLLLRFFGKK